jgi:AcrR family transcriptional regulator
MSHETGLTPRKKPLQRRAQETVEVILEAAAQVFSEAGYDEGTTNRIAERAGVSIGSLYQYFPNKNALLVALVEREVESGISRMESWLAEARLAEAQAAQGDLRSLLCSFVTALVELHRAKPELHRLLFEEASHPPELHDCVLRLEGTLAHGWQEILTGHPESGVSDPDTAAHFLVQTAEALTHRFVQHGIHDLPGPEFEAELVSLLQRYLRG